MVLSGLPQDFRSALADRYLIDREIGAGGMATVWLANEVRYQRPVAIKVLRPDLSATLAHDRFLNEIRIAAALQHPHILTLIDSGTAGGLLFFVTPFMDGETLRQRLDRGGPLPLEEALSLATDVGEALEHAHGRGIVHRDVTPSNILLRESVGVVTDFGIAVAVGMASADRLTQSGVVVGTPEYMSPEQALGEEVDPRSDIYSLACTLFEALAGRPPFSGGRREVLLARHISAPPPELRRLRPDLPRHISDAVGRALAKRPQDRFGSVMEFVSELRDRPVTSAARVWGGVKRLVTSRSSRARAPRREDSPKRPRVVVLPFLDISKEGEGALVGQGVAEEIISAIWKSHGIEVISRTSAFQYQGSGKTLQQIARELNATHAVEGSVQAWAGEFRITVRLVEGRTGEGIAHEAFSIPRDEEQVLQVQYEIARWVVGALGETVRQGGEEAERPSVLRAELALYRGRDAWSRRSAAGFQEAHKAFAECLKADPRHPKGHAAMADLYNLLGAFDYAYLAPKEAFPLSLRYARKALELDPSLAEAHAALANAQLSFEWDGVAAGNSLEAAIALNPGYSPARQWYSVLLMMEGREGEAEVEAYRALEYDPKSPFIWANIGRILQFRREYDQAAEKFEIAATQSRPYPPARLGLALALAQGGNPGAALDILEAFSRRVPAPFPLLESLRGYALALVGRADEARKVALELESLYLAHPQNARTPAHTPPPPAAPSETTVPYVSAEFVAGIHLALGEREAALQWLELAAQNRSQAVAFLGIEPTFDPLRSEPRFQALARPVRLRACAHPGGPQS